MDESERLQRIKQNIHWQDDLDKDDEKFANRIAALLNHPEIDQYCMVDAYYYDYSVIPDVISEKYNRGRDCYLIYGITIHGELVSKIVDRWDLDSNDPIIDGKVIEGERDLTPSPYMDQNFSVDLLATPCPDFLKLFNGNKCTSSD